MSNAEASDACVPDEDGTSSRRPSKWQREAAALRELYIAERRRWKPRSTASGPFPASWPVVARLKQHGPEAMRDMVLWAHRCPGGRAAFLRGESDGAEGESMGHTLFRRSKCSAYVDMAKRWVEQGRPEAQRIQTPTGAIPAAQATDAAWTALAALPGMDRPNRRQPPVVAGEVRWPLVAIAPGAKPTAEQKREHARRLAALTAAGGYRAWCDTTDRDRERFIGRWKAAYLRELGGNQ